MIKYKEMLKNKNLGDFANNSTEFFNKMSVSQLEILRGNLMGQVRAIDRIMLEKERKEENEKN